MPKKSILFVNPDYHCSFFLRDEFRRLGWKADLYKSHTYPDRLLFSEDYIVEPRSSFFLLYFFQRLMFLFKLIWRYNYFVVYGNPRIYPLYPNEYVRSLLPEHFSIELMLFKLFKKKLIHFPSGCREEVLKKDFSNHENGKVCANCGWAAEVCNDQKNQYSFNLRNTYFDYNIANTPIPSTRLDKHLVKYKSLDLDLYHPELEVPEAFRLPKRDNIRILHSFFNKDREHGKKNIKGSPYILAAIERLKREGYPVEYYYLNDIPLKNMRFYQVQADIVVEQLIYGWWGSTGVETMALGKPVVCYITPLWKKLFLEAFPEYDNFPIVESKTENIYTVLKKLVVDKPYRECKGREARLFAEQHFDVKKNAPELEKIFLDL